MLNLHCGSMDCKGFNCEFSYEPAYTYALTCQMLANLHSPRTSMRWLGFMVMTSGCWSLCFGITIRGPGLSDWLIAAIIPACHAHVLTYKSLRVQAFVYYKLIFQQLCSYLVLALSSAIKAGTPPLFTVFLNWLRYVLDTRTPPMATS